MLLRQCVRLPGHSHAQSDGDQESALDAVALRQDTCQGSCLLVLLIHARPAEKHEDKQINKSKNKTKEARMCHISAAEIHEREHRVMAKDALLLFRLTL